MEKECREIQSNSVHIEYAENGIIISYTEEVEGRNTFDNRCHNYKKEVFKKEETDKAFTRFKELWLKSVED